MVSKLGAQCAYGIVFASFLAGATPATQAAEEAPELRELMLGSLSVYKTEKPFSTIKIGDPKILDIDATTNRTLILNPLADGYTNVLFLDEKGDIVNNLEVLVSQSGPSHRVKIFKRGAIEYYRCGTGNCELFDQKVPAQPPGTTTRSVSTTGYDVNGRQRTDTTSTTQ